MWTEEEMATKMNKIHNMDIYGYRGKYKIYSDGRVFSLVSNKFLKPQKMSSGYLNVTLRSEGKSYTPLIHRLVASHFIGELSDFHINHKNGDKEDNRVENLEIVTQKQNNQHAHDNGLMAKIHTRNKKNTSGKVGVVFDNGYWVARGHKNGKSIYLGRSKNKQEAVKIREVYENVVK